MRPDSPTKSEPHNFKNFICVADNRVDDQVELNEQKREKPKDKGKELVEVNFATKDEEPRLVFMNGNLSVELKREILALLQEFKDSFAPTYAKMLGLNSQLVTYKLNIK